ncbi:hypothetical protein CQA49_08955 [Helicobacter sp. MIT 00-7814]|uniref:hypothetical protein n=1 Tax=unclassified Helicobacter TaxID=2593540 RepID=UPI000E1E815A|nr:MULTISPECIES: hypothetical protein [unclassified Helicobacter]RDU51957.1 hypothetical protein CQA49_08955 [Helicobacter sp. MIT 00-7814]RDU54127.1 hypothetical protein CQA37_05810 [Helicobacter sp. MIT 99-10781]
MNTIEEAFITSANKDIITEAIYEFYIICEKKGVKIPDDFMKECLENTIVFYERYLFEMESKFVGVDFYKIISWFSVFVSTKMFAFFEEKKLHNINSNWIKLIAISVWYMFERLEKEGKKLPKEYNKKITHMVKNEISSKPDFGLGKNGLYMLMKIASKTSSIS